MRAVVQRVTHAQVQVADETVGSIGQGLLVLLGVKIGDTEKDSEYIAGKLVKLRIFEDENGKMNRSVLDVNGSILCVSQFTLLGDALYQNVCAHIRALGVPVETGVFRADMQVTLCNDGPVTILLDSEKLF